MEQPETLVQSKSAYGLVSPYCRAVEIGIRLSMLLTIQFRERLSAVMIYAVRGGSSIGTLGVLLAEGVIATPCVQPVQQ